MTDFPPDLEELPPGPWLRTQPDLLAALPELEGKVLGCWCSPQECHGDVLIRLTQSLNGEPDA